MKGCLINLKKVQQNLLNANESNSFIRDLRVMDRVTQESPQGQDGKEKKRNVWNILSL